MAIVSRKALYQSAERKAFDQLFQKISTQYPTPHEVQKLLRKQFVYNLEEGGETVSSALVTWQRKKAHCLEASMLAAAILEKRGYPPLVLSLESQDGMDHVLFVFKEEGRWGAISRSREEGLHGRAPIFQNLRDLARSYADPYVDESSRLMAYGLANLDATQAHWRDSPRNLWQVEDYLIDLQHTKLPTSEKRYQELVSRAKEGPILAEAHWW